MTMQMNLHPQYIVDENGNKTSVVLSIDEFENIQNNLENIQNTKIDSELKELQVTSMQSTWDNDLDRAWSEL